MITVMIPAAHAAARDRCSAASAPARANRRAAAPPTGGPPAPPPGRPAAGCPPRWRRASGGPTRTPPRRTPRPAPPHPRRTLPGQQTHRGRSPPATPVACSHRSTTSGDADPTSRPPADPPPWRSNVVLLTQSPPRTDRTPVRTLSRAADIARGTERGCGQPSGAGTRLQVPHLSWCSGLAGSAAARPRHDHHHPRRRQRAPTRRRPPDPGGSRSPNCPSSSPPASMATSRPWTAPWTPARGGRSGPTRTTATTSSWPRWTPWRWGEHLRRHQPPGSAPVRRPAGVRCSTHHAPEPACGGDLWSLSPRRAYGTLERSGPRAGLPRRRAADQRIPRRGPRR